MSTEIKSSYHDSPSRKPSDVLQIGVLIKTSIKAWMYNAIQKHEIISCSIIMDTIITIIPKYISNIFLIVFF